jgi:CRP-like cAMP-binding protein
VNISELLATMSEADERAIRRRCTRVRFAADAYVFHAGEAGDCVHIILKGRVAVTVGNAMGDQLTLVVLGPGDVFGEMALLSVDHHRTGTVQALTAVETLVLHRGDVDDLRRTHPAVDRFLIGLLATRVDRLTCQLLETTELSAPTRIYRQLAYLGKVFGVDDTDEPIPVSQAQVASIAAAKLRVTNAVLAEAKHDGVVDLGRRRITVLDWPEVRKRAKLSLRAAARL